MVAIVIFYFYKNEPIQSMVSVAVSADESNNELEEIDKSKNTNSPKKQGSDTESKVAPKIFNIKAKDDLSNTDYQNGVIFALVEETNYQIRYREEIDEYRGEYYLDLLDSVSQLKSNDAIILPLIDSLAIAGGNRVPNTLADFASKVVAPLSSKFYDKSSNRSLKLGVLSTVNAMLKLKLEKRGQYDLSGGEINDLKKLLLNALRGTDHFLRALAVEGLTSLNDSSVVSELEQVANTDPYSRKRLLDGNQETIWPVREAAHRAIFVIESRDNK